MFPFFHESIRLATNFGFAVTRRRFPVCADDVQNLSHKLVGLAAPNLAELEVAKRNQEQPE
jgi:hypothetical protein